MIRGMEVSFQFSANIREEIRKDIHPMMAGIFTHAYRCLLGPNIQSNEVSPSGRRKSFNQPRLDNNVMFCHIT